MSFIKCIHIAKLYNVYYQNVRIKLCNFSYIEIFAGSMYRNEKYNIIIFKFLHISLSFRNVSGIYSCQGSDMQCTSQRIYS